MNTNNKMLLLATVAVLAALALPSTFAYGSGGYPPYGQYWGYNWGNTNYISPPIYISWQGSNNYCMSGVRSAYWGGFSSCNQYTPNTVRPWNTGGSGWGGGYNGGYYGGGYNRGWY